MPPFHFWTERPLLSVTVTPLARNIETWQTCCNFKLFVASLPRFDLFFAHAAQGTNGIQWFSASRSLKTWLKWRNVGTMKHPVCLARKQYLQTGSRGRVFFGFFWQFVYVTATATVLMSFWVCEISTERPQLPNKAARWDTMPLSCCCKLLGGRNDKTMKISERIHAV